MIYVNHGTTVSLCHVHLHSASTKHYLQLTPPPPPHLHLSFHYHGCFHCFTSETPTSTHLHSSSTTTSSTAATIVANTSTTPTPLPRPPLLPPLPPPPLPPPPVTSAATTASTTSTSTCTYTGLTASSSFTSTIPFTSVATTSADPFPLVPLHLPSHSLPPVRRAACRAAKVKCSRHAPCTRCLRLSLVCTQPPVVQRGRPSHQSRLAQMRAVDTPSSDRPPSFSSLLPQQQMYAQSVPLPPMVQQQPWAILPPEAQQMMMLQQQMGGHALMAKRFAQMHVNQPAPLRISTKLEWSLLANSPLAGEEILGEVKQMERKYDEAQVSIDALRAQLLRLGVQPCI